MRTSRARIAHLFAVILVLAPARLFGQVCVDRGPIVVEFAVDLSGSMTGSRQVAASDFGVALMNQLGATGFLESAGDFAFTDCIVAIDAITTNTTLIRNGLAAVATAPTSLSCSGGADTVVYDAIIFGAGVIYGVPTTKTRLYVVLTDGEHGGTATTPANVAANLPPGVFTELILIANPGDPGHAGLQRIATLAGSHVQVRATTNLNSLVSNIVNRTCRNFRPNAVMTISDTELHLGTEGFNITFESAGSNDPDGSIASRTWTFRRPDGTTFARSETAFTQTFDDSQLRTGDSWQVTLTVTDNRGATHSDMRTFRVIGTPPSITVNGGSIDVLQPISLNVTPVNDVDGGGAFTINWDIVSSPPRSTHGPGSTGQTGAVFTLPTVETDIGMWTIRAHAQDNENTTGDDDLTFEVRNLPPEITLSGATDIDVGQTIAVQTAETADRDGGDLQFTWAILQSPDPSGIAPATSFRTGSGVAGSRLEIPTTTTAAFAGTWIVRLTARDNDMAANSELTRNYTVLVDAPPEARITGPARLGSLSFPLILDGTTSTDPDSDAPHSTLDGSPPSVSGGITSRTWSVTDVPLEHAADFPLGRVDDVFSVDATNPTMRLNFLSMRTGEWTFQLDVRDAENNERGTSHRVEVIDTNTNPVAVSNGPQRYNVIGGAIERDVRLDGSASFDLDNLVSSMTGTGITAYQWNVLHMPPSCTAPSLGTTSAVTLFTAGSLVPLQCHGRWQIELVVTDDDTPARTGRTLIDFIIGNCPDLICIDYPTETLPQLIEFTNRTDVEIGYHVDSGVYGQVAFAGGIFTRLDVLRHGTTTPVYTTVDFNPLATSFGGFNAFHWNGFTTAGARPQPGDYDVRITLMDSVFALSAVTDQELRSIRIATAEVTIAPSSDTIESLDRLRDGSATLAFNYDVTGAATPDALILRIYDASSTMIFERVDAAAGSGTLSWNGVIAPMVFIGTGAFDAEIVATKMGATLSTSARHHFLVVRTDLDVDTDRNGTIVDADDEMGEDAWTKPRGAIFGVNLDRDEGRSVAGVPVPDAIDYDNTGFLANEDLTIGNAADMPDITPVILRGIGVPLPAGVEVFLKVPEVEDIESMHVFKRIAAGETAFWGTAGSRLGNPSPPLEFDVTPFVNSTSAMFAGSGPAGDVTFGIEGLMFRNTGAFIPFDGVIDITLEFRRMGMVIFSDSVELKVAPWMMLPHTQSSAATWVMDHSLNHPFRENAAADPGYKGLDDGGPLTAVPNPAAGSQWFQDHVETGYYQRPGGPATRATFRLPYGTQPAWPPANLLNPDFAMFQLGGDIGNDGDGSTNRSGSYGGNVEVMPPTAAHGLGRIVVGNTRSDELKTFLDSQEVQPPVEIPTSWLSVAHVDEVVAFHPSGTQVFLADPDDAYAALTAIPAANRGRSVFFATGAAPVDGTVSASPMMPNRLETGVDLTGTSWRYVRIYSDAGSGAAGQVAHISSLGSGFLVIDEVWDTGTHIVENAGDTKWVSRWMRTALPSTPTWAVPPAMGDKYVLVEGTREWKRTGSAPVPAIVTVAEVLADTELSNLNLIDARAQIDTARTALSAASGGSLMFISMPTIFAGTRAGFATGRSAVAFTPGTANVQPVGTKLYFPRQFGPRDGGGDIFENRVRSRAMGAEFVDDWDVYHRLDGEVHCGSTIVRLPLSINWWEHQP